jgi:hypothetical protein
MACLLGNGYTVNSLFYFSKYSPTVLTMLFSHAKVKALCEESLRRALLETSSFDELGVPGGEVVEGSRGGVMDFLLDARRRHYASVVDSVEEMFLENAKQVSAVEKAGQKGAVKLIFPLCTGEVRVDEQWPWDVCGGLIGGPQGNRFCTKSIKDATYPHCGVGSHVAHKATLQEGHGYIPSIHDRANTESAFLEPNVASARFPNSIKDLIGQALSHEEWIAFLTYLPDKEVMGSSRELEQESAIQALEKSRMMVSFAITPAAQKTKLPNIVAKILNSKSATNLETRFNEEDDTMDKVELSFENLEAPTSEEWGGWSSTICVLTIRCAMELPHLSS